MRTFPCSFRQHKHCSFEKRILWRELPKEYKDLQYVEEPKFQNDDQQVLADYLLNLHKALEKKDTDVVKGMDIMQLVERAADTSKGSVEYSKFWLQRIARYGEEIHDSNKKITHYTEVEGIERKDKIEDEVTAEQPTKENSDHGITSGKEQRIVDILEEMSFGEFAVLLSAMKDFPTKKSYDYVISRVIERKESTETKGPVVPQQSEKNTSVVPGAAPEAAQESTVSAEENKMKAAKSIPKKEKIVSEEKPETSKESKKKKAYVSILSSLESADIIGHEWKQWSLEKPEDLTSLLEAIDWNKGGGVYYKKAGDSLYFQHRRGFEGTDEEGKIIIKDFSEMIQYNPQGVVTQLDAMRNEVLENAEKYNQNVITFLNRLYINKRAA